MKFFNRLPFVIDILQILPKNMQQALGKSQSYISKLFGGSFSPSIEDALKIKYLTVVSLDVTYDPNVPVILNNFYCNNVGDIIVDINTYCKGRKAIKSIQ